MDNKTFVALNVLKSWAKAAGVPVTEVAGADIGVVTEIGPVGVKIGKSNGDFYHIDADDLNHRSNLHSVRAFKKLLDDLGIQNYKKFWRGDESWLDKRTHNGRDLEDGTSESELTLMRHLEFRIAPNLSREDVEKYGYCVDIASRWFYQRNRLRLERMCIELDDLKQYGRIWMTNFLHRYRRETVAETAPLLMNYLKQRYSEFHRVSSRVDASALPNVGVLKAWQYSDCEGSYLYQDQDSNADKQFVWATAPDIERFEQIVERESKNQKKLPNPKVRSRNAHKRLNEAMANMDKDKLKELLKQASNNNFICEDAQELATKLLNQLELGSVQEEA